MSNFSFVLSPRTGFAQILPHKPEVNLCSSAGSLSSASCISFGLKLTHDYVQGEWCSPRILTSAWLSCARIIAWTPLSRFK